MPPEKTIALPLSGEEIRLAILDKIGEALAKDCYLHPAAAYDFFSGKITIELRCNDMGREDVVKVNVKLAQGDPPPEEPEAVKVELKIDPEPPNQVRIETGQGVPTAAGNKIKYPRKAVEKANG